MIREDRGSRTEADAAAFERRFGPDYPSDDGPDPSDFETVLPAHDCPYNGGVSCRACDIEEQRQEEYERRSDWLAGDAGCAAVWFLFAVLAGSLLALAVTA